MQKEFKPKINPLLYNDDLFRIIIEEAIQWAGTKISWFEVEDKLRKKRDELPELVDNLYAIVLETFFLQARIKFESGTQLVHFRFSTKVYSAAFLSFLSSFLPLQDEVCPRRQDDVITLSELQYYFCNLYYSSWFPSKLKEVIADHYLLKSLRSDEFDFSHRFIRGIIPEATGSRRQNLRPIRRNTHTITHERKVVERLKKVPMYTQEAKRGFSQIQSTTLIDKEMRSSVFGAFKQRTNKLYGVMTHCDDALMNRLLIRDCGTVVRPFDVSSHAQGVNGLAEYIYSPDNIEEFKAQNLLHRKKYGGTNEVLARLRFNPYRTMVCICANTLEARLLAYDFAQELLQEFLRYAKESNIKVNPNFKIPIIFYLPAIGESSNLDTHRVFFYTDSMRKSDLQSAVGFYNIKTLRVERFYNSEYEFLLGLPEITLDILKQPGTVFNSPLAIDMIDRGYIRMLMRILRGHNLAEELFDDFIRNNFIKKDSYVIANLIEVEEFEIANKLIKATNTNINELKFRENSLVGHILSYGTPRQIDYLGRYHIDLEFLLLKAAEKSNWPTIRLYLREYPTNNKVLLGKLLFFASFFVWNTPYARFFLKMGADINFCNKEKDTAVVIAAKANNWELVSLISETPTDSEDNAKFGAALVLALVESRMDIATVLLNAGAKPPEDFNLEGSELINLIESIIQNKIEEKFLPFIFGCVTHEPALTSWFKNCCENKYYNYLDCLIKLKINFSYLISGNHNLLSTMILDEEFAIADKLMEAGEIDAFRLSHGGVLLVDYIIMHGNYNQFKFVGCEKMLVYLLKKKLWERLRHWLSAVEVAQGIDEALFAQIVDGLLEQHRGLDDSDWVAFRQFVQRFLSHFRLPLLGKILAIAFDKEQYEFVQYLLRNGADWPNSERCRFPMLLAIQKGQWEIVKELLDEKFVENAAGAYSAVLMTALSQQQAETARILLDRGVRPLWEYKGQSYPLPIEKFYQLIDQLGSLSQKKVDILCFEYFYQAVSRMLVELPSVSSEMLLNGERGFPIDYEPLAIQMIKVGCSSELIQLLLKDKSEATVVIESPVMIKSITRNTLFISECICACAFELSDQLLKLTHGHKMNLKYGNKSLLDHLVENGNLEQWIYFGLEDIVRKLAQLGHWNKVFEMVESHSVLAGRQYLGVLLHEAAKQHELALVDLLLKKGADTAVYTGSVPVLCQLAHDEKWELIELFCDYDSDEKDDAQYGYAAVVAFRNKRIDLALKLLSRGGLPLQLSDFESALFYAVKYELVDWIPRLIESEKKWGSNDPKWECSGAGVYFSPWRCVLDHPGYNNIVFARDYAEAKSNAMIKSFFEPFSKLYYNPPLERDPYNYYIERVHTTQVFLEAAIYEDAQFATHRMLKFAKHYKLVSEDENNVLKVFEAIGTCCYWGIKNYPSPTKKVIYKIFRAVLERALKDNNVVDHQVSVKFFASEMPDKEYVARIVSRIYKGEINSYDEYLSKAKFQNQASCHTEETVDNTKDTRSQTLVH